MAKSGEDVRPAGGPLKSDAGAAGRDVRADPAYRLKADLFRTLGHPARIRLVEVLADGDLSVGELRDAVELDSSGVSQHLLALRRLGLLESRKAGSTVHYRIKDPRTLRLLEIARQMLVANLEDSRVLLGDLGSRPADRRGRPGQRPT